MVFRYPAHKSSDLSILVDSAQQCNEWFLTRARAIEWLIGTTLSFVPCTTSICFPVNRLSFAKYPPSCQIIKLTWQHHPGWLLHRPGSCWTSLGFPGSSQLSLRLQQVVIQPVIFYNCIFNFSLTGLNWSTHGIIQSLFCKGCFGALEGCLVCLNRATSAVCEHSLLRGVWGVFYYIWRCLFLSGWVI